MTLVFISAFSSFQYQFLMFSKNKVDKILGKTHFRIFRGIFRIVLIIIKQITALCLDKYRYINGAFKSTTIQYTYTIQIGISWKCFILICVKLVRLNNTCITSNTYKIRIICNCKIEKNWCHIGVFFLSQTFNCRQRVAISYYFAFLLSLLLF